MNFHILYDMRNKPWGGGNQFLKALRKRFREQGIYAEQVDDAEAVLINSHQFGKYNRFLVKLWKLTRSRPNTIVLHRVDGPIFMIRGTGPGVDHIIFRFNEMIANGTIYQSEWSKAQNSLSGMRAGVASTVIMNAPDQTVFHPRGRTKPRGKVKIISVSWSANLRKGFNIYRYLDQHLDWDRYEMTFVGNSPIVFDNVTHVPPIKSTVLASLLYQHDIFLTASQQDPCSNSLIEALHCGLPAVGLNSGGHPEIIGEAGELFESEKDVLSAIEQVATNLEHYRMIINVPTIAEIGDAYNHFAKEVASAKKQGNIPKKCLSIPKLLELISRSAWCKYGFK